MENKKPTKAELERRINNALVFVPKDKDYQCVYFPDKGLKLEVTQDNTIISTTFHKHVFANITSNGISIPYIYTRRFIEIALETNCTYKDENGNILGYSYAKLMDELKTNDEKSTEYTIAFYCDLWFYNIFNPLYSIGNSESASYAVYFDYIFNIAKNSILLAEHADGLTTKQFVEGVMEKFKEIAVEVKDAVMFEKETDEQRIEKEIKSLQDLELEKTIDRI